jgi:hypothetical protein
MFRTVREKINECGVFIPIIHDSAVFCQSVWLSLFLSTSFETPELVPGDAHCC